MDSRESPSHSHGLFHSDLASNELGQDGYLHEVEKWRQVEFTYLNSSKPFDDISSSIFGPLNFAAGDSSASCPNAKEGGKQSSRSTFQKILEDFSVFRASSNSPPAPNPLPNSSSTHNLPDFTPLDNLSTSTPPHPPITDHSEEEAIHRNHQPPPFLQTPSPTPKNQNSTSSPKPTFSSSSTPANSFNDLPRVAVTYLDHAGASLYPESAARQFSMLLTKNLICNPHSVSELDSLINQVRVFVLKEIFHAPLNEYSLIFTSGATAGLRLVADAFDFGKGGVFAYNIECHTSVLGMREVAKTRGVSKMVALSLEDVDSWVELIGGRSLNIPLKTEVGTTKHGGVLSHDGDAAREGAVLSHEDAASSRLANRFEDFTGKKAVDEVEGKSPFPCCSSSEGAYKCNEGLDFSSEHLLAQLGKEDEEGDDGVESLSSSFPDDFLAELPAGELWKGFDDGKFEVFKADNQADEGMQNDFLRSDLASRFSARSKRIISAKGKPGSQLVDISKIVNNEDFAAAYNPSAADYNGRGKMMSSPPPQALKNPQEISFYREENLHSESLINSSANNLLVVTGESNFSGIKPDLRMLLEKRGMSTRRTDGCEVYTRTSPPPPASSPAPESINAPSYTAVHLLADLSSPPVASSSSLDHAKSSTESLPFPHASRHHLTSPARDCWYLLLDAAKLAGNGALDLRDPRYAQFDFIVVSFYKMFGLPTGLGAVIVRSSATKVLKGSEAYYGGGNVVAISALSNFVRFRDALSDRFEMGTVNFQSILCLPLIYRAYFSHFTPKALLRHAKSVCEYCVSSMQSLQYAKLKDVEFSKLVKCKNSLRSSHMGLSRALLSLIEGVQCVKKGYASLVDVFASFSHKSSVRETLVGADDNPDPVCCAKSSEGAEDLHVETEPLDFLHGYFISLHCITEELLTSLLDAASEFEELVTSQLKKMINSSVEATLSRRRGGGFISWKKNITRASHSLSITSEKNSKSLGSIAPEKISCVLHDDAFSLSVQKSEESSCFKNIRSIESSHPHLTNEAGVNAKTDGARIDNAFTLQSVYEPHRSLPTPLKILTHSDNIFSTPPMCVIFGNHKLASPPGAATFSPPPNLPDDDSQGPTIAFLLLDSEGRIIRSSEVVNEAKKSNIILRVGSHCNIGGVHTHLHITDEMIRKNFELGKVCNDEMDFGVDSAPTGCLRVSFGGYSTREDVDNFIEFLKSRYLLPSMTESGYSNIFWVGSCIFSRRHLEDMLKKSRNLLLEGENEETEGKNPEFPTFFDNLVKLEEENLENLKKNGSSDYFSKVSVKKIGEDDESHSLDENSIKDGFSASSSEITLFPLFPSIRKKELIHFKQGKLPQNNEYLQQKISRIRNPTLLTDEIFAASFSLEIEKKVKDALVGVAEILRYAEVLKKTAYHPHSEAHTRKLKELSESLGSQNPLLKLGPSSFASKFLGGAREVFKLNERNDAFQQAVQSIMQLLVMKKTVNEMELDDKKMVFFQANSSKSVGDVGISRKEQDLYAFQGLKGVGAAEDSLTNSQEELKSSKSPEAVESLHFLDDSGVKFSNQKPEILRISVDANEVMSTPVADASQGLAAQLGKGLLESRGKKQSLSNEEDESTQNSTAAKIEQNLSEKEGKLEKKLAFDRTTLLYRDDIDGSLPSLSPSYEKEDQGGSKASSESVFKAPKMDDFAHSSRELELKGPAESTPSFNLIHKTPSPPALSCQVPNTGFDSCFSSQTAFLPEVSLFDEKISSKIHPSTRLPTKLSGVPIDGGVLKEICIYPLKGASGIRLSSWIIDDDSGCLLWDRLFFLENSQSSQEEEEQKVFYPSKNGKIDIISASKTHMGVPLSSSEKTTGREEKRQLLITQKNTPEMSLLRADLLFFLPDSIFHDVENVLKAENLSDSALQTDEEHSIGEYGGNKLLRRLCGLQESESFKNRSETAQHTLIEKKLCHFDGETPSSNDFKDEDSVCVNLGRNQSYRSDGDSLGFAAAKKVVELPGGKDLSVLKSVRVGEYFRSLFVKYLESVDVENRLESGNVGFEDVIFPPFLLFSPKNDENNSLEPIAIPILEAATWRSYLETSSDIWEAIIDCGTLYEKTTTLLLLKTPSEISAPCTSPEPPMVFFPASTQVKIFPSSMATYSQSFFEDKDARHQLDFEDKWIQNLRHERITQRFLLPDRLFMKRSSKNDVFLDDNTSKNIKDSKHHILEGIGRTQFYKEGLSCWLHRFLGRKAVMFSSLPPHPSLKNEKGNLVEYMEDEILRANVLRRRGGEKESEHKVYLQSISVDCNEMKALYHIPRSNIACVQTSPFLLISESTLEFIQPSFDVKLNSARFRSNFLVSGLPPLMERSFSSVIIDSLVFEVEGGCIRCRSIDVNPENGKRDSAVLRSLATVWKNFGEIKASGSFVLRKERLPRMGIIMHLMEEPLATSQNDESSTVSLSESTSSSSRGGTVEVIKKKRFKILGLRSRVTIGMAMAEWGIF